MNLDEFITINNIRCKAEIGSKKKALVLLSEILTQELDDLNQDIVLNKLKERERLGSTGLGSGIAIPHCRVKDLTHAKLAFISLENTIDFDAVDQVGVDILFCLLVPENCTDQHLQILAFLANMLSHQDACHALRHCTDEMALYQYICNWSPLPQASGTSAP